MDVAPQPANAIGYLLDHLSGMLARQSDQVLQEQLGIGLSQYKIMQALEWNPHVRQRKLAQSLGQTEASISRQIKLLHEKGMLLTRINPVERREHITEITTKGAKIAEAAHKIIAQYHTPLLEGLGQKQRQQLVDMLTLIHGHVCQPGQPHACDHPLGL